MKKLLVLVMMFLVISLFMAVDSHATSASLDTGDEAYTSSYTKTLYTDIVPNVQLTDPGSIKVIISWGTLNLNFEKKIVRLSNGSEVKYYALKTPQTLVFNIENKSSPGSSSSFDGTIYVTPSYERSDVQGSASSNIRVIMEEQTKVHTIPLNGFDNSIVLEYRNVDDSNFGGLLVDQLLSGSALEEQIRDIMKTRVNFNISTSK